MKTLHMELKEVLNPEIYEALMNLLLKDAGITVQTETKAIGSDFIGNCMPPIIPPINNESYIKELTMIESIERKISHLLDYVTSAKLIYDINGTSMEVNFKQPKPGDMEARLKNIKMNFTFYPPNEPQSDTKTDAKGQGEST